MVGYLLDVPARLNDYEDFLTVDLQRSKRTTYEKILYITRFLKTLKKPLNTITREDVRSYLKNYIDKPYLYKNMLGALKTFFRDYLNMPEIVQTFKFPKQQFKPKIIVTKEELLTFHDSIDSIKEKTLFMLYATSGLRRNEVLSLSLKDINLENRMLLPNCHHGNTKHSFVSFYNHECEITLAEYLKTCNNTQRLFPFASDKVKKLWKTSRERTNIEITPQRLREFFCMEMCNLGVPDRYIDAFCGRTPKSILAKYYSDYNPIKLKEIYDKANLTVLA